MIVLDMHLTLASIHYRIQRQVESGEDWTVGRQVIDDSVEDTGGDDTTTDSTGRVRGLAVLNQP